MQCDFVKRIPGRKREFSRWDVAIPREASSRPYFRQARPEPDDLRGLTLGATFPVSPLSEDWILPFAVEEILGSIKSLEPLPQVCPRVMDLAAKDQVAPRELIAVIHTDPGITAKVLKLCNSAYYGFVREITSLQEAGNLLGVNTLVNLVVTACAGRYFRDFGNLPPQVGAVLWERAVASALASSLIARLHGGVDKNTAYTAGLLQDLGTMVIERFFPLERGLIRKEVSENPAADLIQVEREILGLDHAEIGARLCEDWHFPALLTDTIRNHHAPPSAIIDPTLCAVIHVGQAVTEALAEGEGLDRLAYDLSDDMLGLVGFDRSRFEALEETLLAELDRAREFVS